MPAPGRPLPRPSPPLIVSAAFALLLLAWVVSNPPGASPDEPAHLAKALATASTDPGGRPDTYPESPEFGPRQLRWINQVTRSFAVPARRTWPTVAPCNAFRPEVPSDCLGPSLDAPRAGERSRSYLGTYQPYLYGPMGAAARFGSTPGRAIWLGRLVAACLSMMMLAAAAHLVWDRRTGALSLVGLFAAVTPMVVFLGASLSPNGVEVAAGVATIAAVLHLARPVDRQTRLAWVTLGGAGTILALARSTGPVWLGLALLIGVYLLGPRRSWRRTRAAGRLALWSAGAMAVGVALCAGWELAVQPRPARSTQAVVDNLLPSFSRLPEVLRQLLGVFGWLDAAMPAAAYLAWRLLLVVLVTVALLAGTRRQRVVLVATLLTVVTVTVALSALAVLPTGFEIQGRYVLAIAVAVPLLAGEVINRSSDELGRMLPARFPLAVAAVVSAVHLGGWYANARRHAVGVRGPIAFFTDAAWSPPAGWLPWGVAVVIALSMLVWAGRSAPRTA